MSKLDSNEQANSERRRSDRRRNVEVDFGNAERRRAERRGDDATRD
jgi:hypothetical protein